jgi:hypothetical protein
MEVLKNEQERLDAALGKEQAFYRVERPMAALTRVTRLPLGIIDWDLEQSQEGWKRRLKSAIQRHELSGDFLTDVALIVTITDLKIRLEQVDDRQVWRRPSVGDGPALEHEPAGPVHVRELEEEPRFSDACLADNCDQLTTTLGGLFERAAKALEFIITANETGQRARSQSLQSPPDGPGSCDLEHFDLAVQAFDGHRSQRPHVDVALD